MDSFSHTNLLHLFDFYLATMFILSTALRVRQYIAVVRLAVAWPERWPRLWKLVRQHHLIFFSWRTGLPALTALGLLIINSLACRLVWPHAKLTAGGLFSTIGPALAVGLMGVAMVTFDTIGLFWVGAIDRLLLEQYFDQAEYWLRSWAAPAVRVFTFGYVNPRRMVDVEVRKALESASLLLNQTLWWVAAQAGLRISFGLSLWLTWAWGEIS